MERLESTKINQDSQKQNLESSFSESNSLDSESSLLDSLSHGYSLDSQNRLFAQKKRGFPSPRSPQPRKR